MANSSRATENGWKYDLPGEPNDQGMLSVSTSPPHQIYWHEYGNPQGEPVLFLHGGPGAGTSARNARFFDPKRYRIILFDQRGCGKSIPSVADDPVAALRANTTADLISDIEELRKDRGITGKMHLFGGSWGSTLALAYAIAKPDHVASLTLRGTFLCRKKDVDYFNQGNALHYQRDPQDESVGAGAYRHYPQAWKTYVEAIAPSERHDMVAAYNAELTREMHSASDREHRDKIASAWSGWEGAASYHAPEAAANAPVAVLSKDDLNMAILESHYLLHGGFLSGHDRNQNYILENASKITASVHIVHGRFDEVSPLFQSEELEAKLKSLGKQVDLTVTEAGHSMYEAQNVRALTAIMDGLPQELSKSVLNLAKARELMIIDERFTPPMGKAQGLNMIAAIEQAIDGALARKDDIITIADPSSAQDDVTQSALRFLKERKEHPHPLPELPPSAYAGLQQIFVQRGRLLEGNDIISWHQQVEFLPADAQKAVDGAYTATQLFAHNTLVRPEMRGWLQQAESEVNAIADVKTRAAEKRNLFLMKRLWIQETGLKEDLVRKFNDETNDGYAIWKKSKPINDYAAWQPSLQRVVDVTRERAEALAEATHEKNPYQALLDERNPGLKDDDVTRTFDAMEKRLRRIIPQIIEKQKREEQGTVIIPLPVLSDDDQFKVCSRVMKDMGLDPSFTRLDKIPHPTSNGRWDNIRLSTRLGEKDTLKTLISLIHESGHGLYDHSLPRDHEYQPVSGTAGMWVHETQSLFWEKQVALSKPFATYLSRVFKEELPNRKDPAFSADNLHRLVTHVEQSPVRTSADEVTYPMHVILRHKLEKRLLDKSLAVKDLPAAWNTELHKLLPGVNINNDTQGCMQDVHWSSGIFGSFPGYTYGALGAAQLMEALRKERTDVDSNIEKGNFTPLRVWLTEKIHSQGAHYDGMDLFERATGKALSPDAWFRHIEERYGVKMPEVGDAGQGWGERTGALDSLSPAADRHHVPARVGRSF